MDDKKNSKKNIILNWDTFTYIFIGVFVLWIIAWIVILNVLDKDTFGAMIGAVNALFTALVFAALISILFLQKKELYQQGEELKEQKKQIEIQNETLKKQIFEKSFYQLLELQRNILNALNITREGNIYRGRDSFTIFYNHFVATYKKYLMDEEQQDLEKLVNKTFQEFFMNCPKDMEIYFQNLENVLRFIHANEISDKNIYRNILRAQLSTPELLLIFYYCLSDIGIRQLKPLVMKFDLLKNLPRDIMDKEHLELFNRAG